MSPAAVVDMMRVRVDEALDGGVGGAQVVIDRVEAAVGADARAIGWPSSSAGESLNSSLAANSLYFELFAPCGLVAWQRRVKQP